MSEDNFTSIDSLRGTPESDMEIPALTVSPADTSLNESPEDEFEDDHSDEKKPSKKRKSWGQELPVPKTNLPPRYVRLHILVNQRQRTVTNAIQKTSQDR